MDRVIEHIVGATKDPELRRYVTDLLVEICRIDTTPFADVTRMRDAEDAVFGVLEHELDQVGFPGAHRERRPIDPGIAAHPAFSKLHFTKTEKCPDGLTPEQVYAERGNLLYFVPGYAGREGPTGVAVNAHIDVVKPFIPPRVECGTVYGRGSCDDKGGVVAIIAALKLLADALSATGSRLRENVVGMFVVEEETGGNGSLSLAVDRELKKHYSRILVLECTGNRVHPANRGAVWYRAELAGPGINLFEMSAFVIEQFEKEGRAIRAESRHDLFPQRPVQTCHGMIGPYGEHPSRICGEVAFRIELGKKPTEKVECLIRDVIDSALHEYRAVYGDKTKEMDPATGKPKVDHHYDLIGDSRGFVCHVHGATGHMGAILENDGAITKMAAFVRALIRSKCKIDRACEGTLVLSLLENGSADALVLEGGQGFVPTHDITDVMERVKAAAERGAAEYLRDRGRRKGSVQVTFDKLHNAAFDGDPDSATMRNAIEAAKAAGTWTDDEVMGWTVSCDSRLFATEYPEMPVITSGAGHLTHAHSDEERIRLDELMDSVAFVAVFLLREAGLAPCR